MKDKIEEELEKEIVEKMMKSITPVGKVAEITLAGDEFRKCLMIIVSHTKKATLEQVREIINKYRYNCSEDVAKILFDLEEVLK